MSNPSIPAIVTELRALLGPDVVLIHVRRGEKGPRWKGWQKTTLAHMANPAYLAQFANGCNVGALLGNASGGLCAVDIDDDAAAESFLALNPKLQDALRSRRLRGCNCWLRIIGSYPPSGKIRDAAGQDVGEWRGTGCQTLIHGEAIDRKKGETQPTPYKISRNSRPVEIRFEEIVWPDGWVLPCANSALNATRPLKVAPPESLVTFEQWRAAITANFPAYLRPAEVCASVVGQLLLNDVANPFALALVDVPSSGKTITLNFFAVPVLAYPTDSFTPASFVSHASNLKRNELATVDMLPRIRFRALIVRDLAPVFGAKEDDLVKSLGILTRVLDGEGLETDSGVHGKRGYKGDWLFMLLAGTTPIPPRVFKIMGTLGSRLFFLALHPPVKSHDELIAQNQGQSRQQKEQTCRKATESFLRTLWAANPNGIEWNKAGDPLECLRVIARCAELLAALRGTILVWKDEHDWRANHTRPVIEQPDRINCLLYNLARGHALIRGQSQLAAEDLAPVLEVTFDSAPTIRSKVFRGLVRNGGTLTTGEVEKILRCSNPTALKEMETLDVLRVAEKVEPGSLLSLKQCELRLAPQFSWFTSDECKSLRWPDLQTQAGHP